MPQFSSEEVLDAAIRLEEAGLEFYREAARIVVEPAASAALLALAKKEEEHASYFRFIKNNMQPEKQQAGYLDSGGELAEYLAASAAKAVLPARDPAGWLTGKEQPGEIFKKAVEIEKDSVIFYLALRDSVSDKAGRDRVEAIIREEMSHIALLTAELEKIRATERGR